MTDLTPAFVEALVHRLFGPADRDAATAALERYGDRPHEREPVRVRVAALKLSQGDLGRLREALDRAARDYRDVLAWAEYPEELERPTWRLPAEEVDGIRSRDRAQYRAWLAANGWEPGRP
jgi:hypothetical protein